MVSAGVDCLSVGGPLVGGGIKKCVYLRRAVFQLDFFIMFIGLARSRYDACYWRAVSCVVYTCLFGASES